MTGGPRLRSSVAYALGRDRPGRHVQVRPDDAFIVSYPKSGNTWVRFLVANLLRARASVDFVAIETLVPDIYVATSRQLEVVRSPRLLKSHEYFDPRYPRVLYIVRDPRDVLVSYFHHQRKVRRITDDTPLELFAESFLAGTADPYGTWEQNVRSWTCACNGSETFLTLRYEDILEDPQGALTKAAAFLSITANDDAIARAVAASSFDNMRRLEEVQGETWKPTRGTRSDVQFVRSGRAGEGRTQLAEECEARIRRTWGETMRTFGYT